jgi:hypothetical protein
MNPTKGFMVFWNLMAVVGLLVTFALFGALLAEFSQWALNFLQNIFSSVGNSAP